MQDVPMIRMLVTARGVARVCHKGMETESSEKWWPKAGDENALDGLW